MMIDSPPGGASPGPGNKRKGIAGPVIALVLGTLLALLGVVGILAGTASATILAQKGAVGYLTSPMRNFSTASYALTSPPAKIGVDELPFDLGGLRFVAESTEPGNQVFIGIAPKADVDRYLSGIHTTEITDVRISPFRVRYRDTFGSGVPAPPAEQGFWAASASGPGTQQITMDLRSGDWTLVIMNADAQPGVTADVQAGVNSTLFGKLPPGLWIGGIVILVIGAGLITLGAILLGRRTPAPRAGTFDQPSAGKHYPARLTGHLDAPLSRGLWLIKWLLAIPHFIVLFFLWFALVFTTIVSGFAILFTGRYPRPLFDFAVGVLRWSWRVAFYSYSALATDQYPPFTLESTNYPADFQVDYPRTLSHGLVLVKWWLLAIPHLLIVSIFSGSALILWNNSDNLSQWDSDVLWSSNYGSNVGFSLLGLLVLIAGFMLLFTDRYQRPLFDLVMGINRWIYRVATYTLLLRDEYPPFKLDQGADDPGTAKASTSTPSPLPDNAPEPPLQ